MLANTFETINPLDFTGNALLDSEALGLKVQDAVFMGFSFANIGTQSCTLIVETKAHPSGAWLPRSPFSNAAATNVSNSFYRQVVNVSSTGVVTPNTVGFISLSLKFVYAIRIRANVSAIGNTARIRGNIKTPLVRPPRELSVQQWTARTVTNADYAPTFVDCSDYAYLSSTFIAAGTNTIQTIAANTIPGITTSTTGYLLAVRFYPGDTSFLWVDTAGTLDAIQGAKTSIVIASLDAISPSNRRNVHRIYVESAYEIGWLWNIPGNSVVDYYVSMNG